jgi:hypothetical protein
MVNYIQPNLRDIIFSDLLRICLTTQKQFLKKLTFFGPDPLEETIVTTDGHQVSEEGWHGSMIIQQGGTPHTSNSGMDIFTVCLTKHEAGGLK